MRLYQPGALLTGARNELIRSGGIPVDGPRVAAHAHGRLGITQCVAAQGDTIEHCMNVHALTLRERFGDALER